jgi:exodeoxyribonuclease VII large subunit
VTSATGAAIHDILNVLKRRFANVAVLLYPVRVQGEGAAEEIAGAIRDFNRYREVDVLIVGRGGGSLEDLWAFNEEVVARAIYHSRIPVISAVGHEIDVTIADFVADLRAPTPSAAAELVVRSKDELEREIDDLRHRLEQGMRHSLTRFAGALAPLARGMKDPSLLMERLAQRVDHLGERLGLAAVRGVARRRDRLAYLGNNLRLKNPALELAHALETLEALRARGEHALHRLLEKSRERTAGATGKLQGLSPLLTLARGYAVVRKHPAGNVVTAGSQLRPGERIGIRLHRGSLVGVVEETYDDAVN